MLTNVYLKNLALIDEAEIDFEKGLNIMTGETGSGKSIIISSISIALGGKASKSLIRTGSACGIVELTFTDIPDQAGRLLDSLGISHEGNHVIITRKITPESSISRINGENVSLASVRALTSLLIDIHGQHDHQSLLDPQNHIRIVDRFGGDKVESARSDFRSHYDRFRSLRKEYTGYDMDEIRLEREISLLEHERSEIEDAGLTFGEDEKLEREYKMMGEWENISDSLNKALISLDDESSGAVSRISDAMAAINQAISIQRASSGAYDTCNAAVSGTGSYDSADADITDADAAQVPDTGVSSTGIENDDLAVFKSVITDLDSVARDISHDLMRYVENHRFDRERYAKIRDRLNEINKIKSRYGSTIAEVLKYYNDITSRLENYKDYTEHRNRLIADMQHERAELNKAAAVLSDARKEAASVLEPLIISNLKELNFLTVQFSIDFKKADKISDNGFDKVEFLISVNPGERLMPLIKVASGGELSRIMLAIKSSAADNDEIPTLIFDEIDTGISGRSAQMVAEKLSSLSSLHQIICITHLPQIAAMGDINFMIHKEVTDGATISGVEKLDLSGKTEEIARLVGGVSITQAALDNASDMISQAELYKQQCLS